VADDSAEFSFDSTNNVGPDPGQGNPWQVYWQKKTWRFVATEEKTTMIFASNDDPNTEYSVAIDNVIVHDAGIYERLTGDLDWNDQCDMNDLAFLAYYWLEYCGWNDCDCYGADINGDGIVNFIDYALLAGNWLQGVISPVQCGLVLSSTEGGSVTEPGEGAYMYDCGAEVIVVATADNCNHFIAWTGTAVNADKVGDPCSSGTTVTVDGNYTLQANFAIDRFELDLSSTEGGSVTEPGEGTYMYDCGTEVIVIATADDCNNFVEWTGTAVDAGKVGDQFSPGTTVTVDDNYTVQANFAIEQHQLVLSSTEGGSVTEPGEGSYLYDCETEIIVVATTDNCNHFVAWTGTAVDAGKVGDPCSPGTTVTVDNDYTLQANFAADQYQLFLSSTEGGSVTVPGEGTYLYNCGAEVTVVATADDCNHFVAWTGTAVDAGKIGDPCSHSTTVTIDDNYTLQANFEMNPYSIVFENNLDTNPGWPTQGQWSFGEPNGAGGDLFGYPDPTSGYTGSNVFGVNLNGDYDTAIGGPYYLTAGPFDLSGIHEVELRFANWLNTDNPNYVVHKLEISVDASNWSTVWVHSGVDDITSNEWEALSYDISSIADDESSVCIRWGYEVTAERTYSYSGWNIDDIQLWGRALIQ